ncbi:NADP-dependent oxidoreductase [Pacificimonas flava]|uniref:NADP-dependent oxidoreductase n=2 Tax=Pacificimonas TaxID=1960290 RepID=A0A219B3W9_9SPHN|nr:MULTISPECIES: NADP-dependent oxidoreductase [Pacificimonas]MBZ6377331.1 NADP-dependent oxidoreductase [Pacificimonas aurantium]OWV32961.1 NADP-dependent oxidoreductase [Pacificimonas flava]
MQRQVWKLASRPEGDISDGDLRYETEEIAPLKDGEALIQTLYLSLDPTNRIWMSDREQYMPPVELGAAMRGGIAGRVLESRNPDLAEGTIVAGLGEWATHVTAPAGTVSPMALPDGVDLAAAFGTFGGVGMTAYFGLLDIGQPKEGETLVVSAAAGGVGQIVGQIGKIKGCKVIGIAGGPEKCGWITDDLGFDHAIDYKAEDVGEALDRLAPEGIDIDFENVGGPIMAAVLERMKTFGRIPLCGLISQYNETGQTQGGAPAFWETMLMRRLTVRGFIVTDFAPRFAEGAAALGGWMAEGRLKTRQDVRKDLAKADEHVKLLYSGGNFGKLLVEVSEP